MIHKRLNNLPIILLTASLTVTCLDSYRAQATQRNKVDEIVLRKIPSAAK